MKYRRVEKGLKWDDMSFFIQAPTERGFPSEKPLSLATYPRPPSDPTRPDGASMGFCNGGVGVVLEETSRDNRS